MAVSRDLLDSLAEEVELASAHEDPSEQALALEDVAGRINAILQTARDASLHFLLGYVWYLHPRRLASTAIQRDAKQALQAALTLDPKHARAWMYLGHAAYDLGEFEAATECFRQVDLGQLGTYWEMKVREMRVCCEIALRGLGPSMALLEDYLAIAERMEVQDIMPNELARWIKKLAPTLSTVDRARLRDMARRLDSAGHFTNWFTDLVEHPQYD